MVIVPILHLNLLPYYVLGNGQKNFIAEPLKGIPPAQMLFDHETVSGTFSFTDSLPEQLMDSVILTAFFRHERSLSYKPLLT
jgi:hypothetical protein